MLKVPSGNWQSVLTHTHSYNVLNNVFTLRWELHLHPKAIGIKRPFWSADASKPDVPLKETWRERGGERMGLLLQVVYYLVRDSGCVHMVSITHHCCHIPVRYSVVVTPSVWLWHTWATSKWTSTQIPVSGLTLYWVVDYETREAFHRSFYLLEGT